MKNAPTDRIEWRKGRTLLLRTIWRGWVDGVMTYECWPAKHDTYTLYYPTTQLIPVDTYECAEAAKAAANRHFQRARKKQNEERGPVQRTFSRLAGACRRGGAKVGDA